MMPKATALVIGAGPAGLMAADQLLQAGLSVMVAEGKPSPGRKFLMAGKSGLNITKAEPDETFLAAYTETSTWLRPMITAFGPEHVQNWARELGQEVFTGSSGRVFPRAMKASPLLRAWLADLTARGMDLRPRWRWTGFEAGTTSVFATPEGDTRVTPSVTVLALGGASWARLGSDGAWAPVLAAQGVALAPFRPANMGFRVAWSSHMAPHFGTPLKSIALVAGPMRHRGEAVITQHGLEGGGVYAVSRALRDGSPLHLDLVPDVDLDRLTALLDARPKGESSTNTLRKLGLSPGKLALVQDCARPLPREARALAQKLKALPVPLLGPNLMDQAISTAGGIAQDAVTDGLMLRALPGVFVAGEMLDWEAPTGGYLLTACLATGRHAGRAAALWSAQNTGQYESGA